MKTGAVSRALYLARVQSRAWSGASSDEQLAFELATLWFLNQAQDALIAAVREHHGLKGAADESATQAALAGRELPSAALDQVLSWPAWSACRKALANAGRKAPGGDGIITLADGDGELMEAAVKQGYMPWCDGLADLTDALTDAYAEF